MENKKPTAGRKSSVTKTVQTDVVKVVEEKATGAYAQAQKIQITSQAELDGAAELLSNVKKLGKFITQEKEKITKPMREALDNARALFAPFEKNAKEAEVLIKDKMSDYMLAQEKKRREEEEKIAKKVEAGRMKEETAIKKLEQMPEQARTVASGGASATMAMIKDYRIVDESLIPREYLVVDTAKIRKAMHAGTPIPGVEYYEKPSIQAR